MTIYTIEKNHSIDYLEKNCGYLAVSINSGQTIKFFPLDKRLDKKLIFEYVKNNIEILIDSE